MGNVSLPAIVSKLPNDVRNFLQRVRELLVDLDTRSTVTTGGTTTTIIIGGGETEPDYTQPPAPTGLTASGSITTIFLQWDDVSASYDNLSHTEIWRSSTNNLGTAVLNGTAQGHIYQDTVEPMSTYYYWVRMVSLANVDGPFNAVNGVAGVTSQDPASVVELLTAHGLYTDTPYYYQAKNTTINGVVVPVGTYINNAYIANGSITTAKIGNAQITNAKINTITASKLTSGTITGQEITVGVGGNIKSGQTAYNTGTGWWIGKGVDGYSRFSVGNPTGAGFDWSEETGAMKFRGIMDLRSGSTIGGISADYIGGWASSLDNAKIDGVNIHADSSILTGSTAPVTGGRYSVLSGGDLEFFDYAGSQWILSKSVTDIRNGVCKNGATVNIGYFRSQPVVILSPYNLQSYSSSHSTQSQTFKLSANNLRKSGTNWLFDAIAQLSLSSGTYSQTGDDATGTLPATTGSGVLASTIKTGTTVSVNVTPLSVNLPANTRQVSVSMRFQQQYTFSYSAGMFKVPVRISISLQYLSGSTWVTGATASLSGVNCSSMVKRTASLSFTLGVDTPTIRVVSTFICDSGSTATAIDRQTPVYKTMYAEITQIISQQVATVINATGYASYLAIG